MKSNNEDRGKGNVEAENDFFPFDRYGNYVAEFPDAMTLSVQKRKIYIEEIGQKVDVSNPTLKIA